MEMNSRFTTVAAVSTAGVIIAGIIATAWWHKRRQRNRIPKRWRRIGELTELLIYPLKSGSGLTIEEADCTDIGCRTEDPFKLRDRFFVVMSEKGTTKTARQHPNMYNIKVRKADSDSITFSALEMNDLTVRIPKSSSEKKVDFTMWQGEHLEAVDCGDEAAKWIHTCLKLKEEDTVRLGYFSEDYVKRRDLASKAWLPFLKAYPNTRRYDTGAYSDMAPFLLINEASINDLRGRIENGFPNISPCWFRPNFVVRGPEAYSEDKWNFIKIGDSAVFQYFKPCTRCVLTTVNPETAQKDPNMEPLKTLKTYRMLKDQKLHELEKSPAMGCYLGLRRPGSVRVGDPVYIGERGC